jgi:Leucine-rich repeat (LRR) protein
MRSEAESGRRRGVSAHAGLSDCAPPRFCHPRSELERLFVGHNQLAALPPPVLGMPGLRELGASHNALTELVGAMQQMTSLQVGKCAE